MRGFGSETSPSLRKMDLANGRYGGNKRFSIGNIIGDPFWLGSISIGICGWLIAFVSSIIADRQHTEYPNYAWWTLVYMLFCIGGVVFVVGADAVSTYQIALSSYLAAALVMTTSAVNSLIYRSEAPNEAAAAGFILLSIDAIVWVFYFGSQPQASHRQTLDSFALHKDHAPSRNSRNMRQSYRPDTNASGQHAPQMYTSSHLAGFETSSPVHGPMSLSNRQSASAFPQPASAAGGAPAAGGFVTNGGNNNNNNNSNSNSLHPHHSMGNMNNNNNNNNSASGNNGSFAASTAVATSGTEQPGAPNGSVTAPTEYPYRAKAIYSYEANPEDANEISFSKHEVLEVSDVSGRWWQAKKENGETGIAPSNYLILV